MAAGAAGMQLQVVKNLKAPAPYGLALITGRLRSTRRFLGNPLTGEPGTVDDPDDGPDTSSTQAREDPLLRLRM